MAKHITPSGQVAVGTGEAVLGAGVGAIFVQTPVSLKERGLGLFIGGLIAYDGIKNAQYGVKRANGFNNLIKGFFRDLIKGKNPFSRQDYYSISAESSLSRPR